MGTLTTIFGHILNIASKQGTKQEQNYGAKQNAGEGVGSGVNELTTSDPHPLNRKLKHMRFRDADGNRKRTCCVPGQWCLPHFYTNYLQWKKDT